MQRFDKNSETMPFYDRASLCFRIEFTISTMTKSGVYGGESRPDLLSRKVAVNCVFTAFEFICQGLRGNYCQEKYGWRCCFIFNFYDSVANS